MKNFYMNKHYTLLIMVIAFGFCLYSCSETNGPAEEKYDFTKVPAGFPPIPYPADNPITTEKVLLGRKLFYDGILSRNFMISCSHCHQPQGSFSTQGQRISKGIDYEPTTRNALALVNVAYSYFYTWDGSVEGDKAIEYIAYHVITLPNEFDADTNEINIRLKIHPEYPELFKKAFDEESQPSAYLAAKAIATFVRVLISGNSKYDKYVRGVQNAMNESEIRGMELFFSDRTKCSKCHSGINFTDNLFHSTGSTNHYFDKGRIHVTNKFEDWGKFKTPTLRNVEVSYPYMHEGEKATLEEVIEHYDKGGFAFFNKDTLIKPLGLTMQEKADLVSFLKALTDWEFLNNKNFKR